MNYRICYLGAMVARFGAYNFDTETNQLLRNGLPVRLQEQPAKVLVALIESAGNLVSREQLQQRIWPADTFVDFDGSLNTAIRKVRYALRDDAENPVFIETVPKQGYRFVAPVVWDVPAPVVEPEPVPLPAPPRRFPAIALLLGLSLPLLIWLGYRSITPSPNAIRLSIPLPLDHELYAGFGPSVTISQDGQTLGFIARKGHNPQQFWMRRLNEAEAQPVTGTEGAQFAQLSPDGSQLLLVRSHTLNLFEAGKGDIRRLAYLGPSIPVAAIWGNDGFVYYTAPATWKNQNHPACLWRIRPEGSEQILLQCGEYRGPLAEYILPLMVLDSNRLLISTFHGTQRSIEILKLQDQKRTRLYGPASGGLWVQPGWLIFHEGNQLRAVSASLDPPSTSGSPITLLNNVQRAGWSGGNLGLSGDGTLIYEPQPKVVGERRLVWVGLDGKESSAGLAPGAYEIADLGVNDNLLLRRYDPEVGKWSVWAAKLRGGEWVEVTQGAGWRSNALLSKDGNSVIYTDNDIHLARRRLNAKEAAGLLTAEKNYRQAPGSILRSGDVLYFQGYIAGRGHDILRWHTDGRIEKLLEGEHQPTISPDEKWLVTRAINGSILVRPYPSLGQPVVVAKSGMAPVWSPDGRQIYYRTGKQMMEVQFTAGNPPRISDPRPLFPDNYVESDLWNQQYAIHPDGKRFLMAVKDPTADRAQALNLILNWTAEFAR